MISLETSSIVDGCLGKYCNSLQTPVFPTPFYETLMAFSIFAVLWFLRKRIIIPGLIFALYLIMNGIERFFIEKIRVNSTYQILNIEVTQAEIISSFLFITGIITAIFLFKKHKNKVTS